MEINFARYLDTLVKKYNDNYLAFNKVKEFISIAQEIGGLNDREKKFIQVVLTDENIQEVISTQKSFLKLYTKFVEKEIDEILSPVSYRCGTTDSSCGTSRPKHKPKEPQKPVSFGCGTIISRGC